MSQIKFSLISIGMPIKMVSDKSKDNTNLEKAVNSGSK